MKEAFLNKRELPFLKWAPRRRRDYRAATAVHRRARRDHPARRSGRRDAARADRRRRPLPDRGYLERRPPNRGQRGGAGDRQFAAFLQICDGDFDSFAAFVCWNANLQVGTMRDLATNDATDLAVVQLWLTQNGLLVFRLFFNATDHFDSRTGGGRSGPDVVSVPGRAADRTSRTATSLYQGG